MCLLHMHQKDGGSNGGSGGAFLTVRTWSTSTRRMVEVMVVVVVQHRT